MEVLTLPLTPGRLRAWLRDTIAGREIVQEITSSFFEEKCRACREPQASCGPPNTEPANNTDAPGQSLSGMWTFRQPLSENGR